MTESPKCLQKYKYHQEKPFVIHMTYKLPDKSKSQREEEEEEEDGSDCKTFFFLCLLTFIHNAFCIVSKRDIYLLNYMYYLVD